MRKNHPEPADPQRVSPGPTPQAGAPRALMSPVLTPLGPGLEARLRRHCEQQYPSEACGALLGSGDGTSQPWVITELRPAPNAHGGDRRGRYLVAPEVQLEAEKHARATGQAVVGYYHSHPNQPARPSEYDRAWAWRGYLYVICSVRAGQATELAAFTLVASGGHFVEVEVAASHLPPSP